MLQGVVGMLRVTFFGNFAYSSKRLFVARKVQGYHPFVLRNGIEYHLGSSFTLAVLYKFLQAEKIEAA